MHYATRNGTLYSASSPDLSAPTSTAINGGAANSSSGPQPPRRTNVPESLLGYARQVDRALVHLLQGQADDAVSLEVVGDTAVETTDGRVLAEEAKSRTGTSNPIADRAVDLWKTFRNWVEAVERGALNPQRTVFQLYVSHPFNGDIVERLASASSPDAADDAISYVWTALGVDPTAADPCAGLPGSLREHVSRVVQADPAQWRQIVTQFRLVLGSGDASAELLASLDTHIIADGVKEPLMEALRGWVLGRVIQLLERREPAVIRNAEFRQIFVEHRRRLETREALLSVATPPTEDEKERELSLRIYVRQLDLIELEDEDKVDAVIDYLTAEADRVAWAQDARIFAEDVEAFERELRLAWRRLRRRGERELSHLADVARGAQLYDECQAHHAPLAGLEVPPTFCRGSFHKLANELTLGWHPDFHRRLTGQAAPTEPEPDRDG